MKDYENEINKRIYVVRYSFDASTLVCCGLFCMSRTILLAILALSLEKGNDSERLSHCLYTGRKSFKRLPQWQTQQFLATLLGLCREVLLANLQRFGNGRAGLLALQPSVKIGELLRRINIEEWENDVPGNKGKVNVAKLATHEIFLVCQVLVQHARDAADLVHVAFLGALDLLWMVASEPDGLAKVRALAGHLEVQPLLGEEVVLRALGEADLVLLVVCLDKVFQDCARFPQGNAGVGVFNGGDTAVGVDRYVGLLLYFGELHVLVDVGNVELLKDHDDLPRIGAARVAMEGDGLERHVAE